MATEMLPQQVSVGRRITAANGGSAVTTTAPVGFGLPPGTKRLDIMCRAVGTATAMAFNFCPWIVVAKSTDGLAAEANFTDYSEECQDGNTSTEAILSSLGTLANGDAVYIASHMPLRGLYAEISQPNGNASVIAAHYWNGSAWTSLTPTDNTISTGASLGLSAGTIVWTPPAAGAWVESTLVEIGTVLGTGPSFSKHPSTYRGYWLRLSWNAAFDANTRLSALYGLANVSAQPEMLPSLAYQSFGVTRGEGGIGGVEVAIPAGSSGSVTAMINAYTGGGRNARFAS